MSLSMSAIVQVANWIRPPVQDWLAEGFDTLDLREANALLDEMGL